MDATLRRPLSRFLMFPPDLEREFEGEQHRERASHFVRCGFLGLFLYDFFLLFHWNLTPDDFDLACLLSLVVFTPMLLFTIYGPTRSRSVTVREVAWTVMPIVAVAFFMLIATMSVSPTRSLSYFSAILVMVFTTAVQRLRLRYTLAANGGMLIVVAASVFASDAFDVHTRSAVLIFFVVAMILMGMAAYAFDRECRLAYLAERQTRLLNAELQRVSRTDPLTGLWNRRHLLELMATAWQEAQAGASMAVLLVDIDHFKRFNDTFGHAAGDGCLVAVGQRLASCNGVGATAVRYGGEEFLLFLPNYEAGPALALAELICADMRDLVIPIGNGTVRVTISIGVAAGTLDISGADLIKAADDALYAAKEQGRDRAQMSKLGWNALKPLLHAA